MPQLDRDEALSLLRELTGEPSAEFRPHQLEAIQALVEDRKRVLLVQRTGWGKSAVYFIATWLLRVGGAGPTLLVSPLLALMRNQIEAAERMGLRAETINSANQERWDEVKDAVEDGLVDLLLVSPERLANQEFLQEVLPTIGRRSGLLVVDEAHCISDWGHDFRPDYRRIVQTLEELPCGMPVLGCTATANDRVVNDVKEQLGSGLVLCRGPLAREGLRLSAFEMPSRSERMAWLAEVVPSLPGTGVIYCLTVRDTEELSSWLRSNDIDAVAYSGRVDQDVRLRIEQDLLSDNLKVVVATSALGMGFDKPDLAFVIHFQSPGSPIAYYQQVGRAGRKLDTSLGILLTGSEDRAIQDYFIEGAFPPPDLATKVVKLLKARAPMSFKALLGRFNVRQGQLEQLMKILEVEGAVERHFGDGVVYRAGASDDLGHLKQYTEPTSPGEELDDWPLSDMEWKPDGRVPDSLPVDKNQLIDLLKDLLTEVARCVGPVIAIRAYHLINGAFGRVHLEKELYRRLNRACAAAVSDGCLTATNLFDLDEPGMAYLVLQLPDRISRRVPHHPIEELPPEKIAAMIQDLMEPEAPPYRETLKRRVLAKLDLVRLRPEVNDVIDRCIDLLYRGRVPEIQEPSLLGQQVILSASFPPKTDGPIHKKDGGWLHTYRNRVKQVTEQRRDEQEQMLGYISTDRCRMTLLREYLDDESEGTCGICDVCSGNRLSILPDRQEMKLAEEHIRAAEHLIEPRKQMPGGGRIAPGQILRRGRVLSVWGDGGWSDLVRRGKQEDGRFDDSLVGASATLLRSVFPAPQWVTFVPSLRNPGLVRGFAERLARSLDLVCKCVVTKVNATQPQKRMQNSQHQYDNVRGAFKVAPGVPSTPVLLVDDVVDSRWTLTVIGGLLRKAGSGPVYPFALADTAGTSAG